ncbi:cobalamin biosynthesis protein [Halobaculum sp. MBLA0147]|uniref:cobalamin biosynthesis protein n=1 Tax=Halobaculum sp. MBLA0147 TaxID=3079934 RepID=UPI003524E45D
MSDLDTASPETAYLWGYVAGDGAVRSGDAPATGESGAESVEAAGLRLTAPDETSAERLAAIAGRSAVEREVTDREYLHDTSITRREESFVVDVAGDFAAAAERFGVPVDGETADETGTEPETGTERETETGSEASEESEPAPAYDFDALADHPRPLLRGIVESTGTVCFKSSSGTVGLSVVHESRQFLRRVQELLDALPVAAPTGDVAEASSGYWFGVDDEAVPAVGAAIYEDCETFELFAPTRRRKLRRSLNQADVEVTARV